jgi:F-type H+-transporting ATPase subunit a
MAASGQGPTSGEYIVHHLTHWQNKAQTSVVDFSVFNIDSIFYSVVLGFLGCFLLWKAARKATSGVPGRFQAAVEMLFEVVDAQAKGIVHNANSRKLVAPLALTVFVWIFLLNAMDMLPVDLLPWAWEHVVAAAGGDPTHAYMRVVPTADLSITMALSLGVLIVCLVYNVKIKGVGGWIHELFSAPFGAHPLLWLPNFAMQMIEFVAKTVSHGMRLFGNMYAGELIFMLIALMGGAWTLSLWSLVAFLVVLTLALFATRNMGALARVAVVVGIAILGVLFLDGAVAMVLGHIIAGTAWTIFHILIIVLQAFVFMMLTLVYIGQAHDAH